MDVLSQENTIDGFRERFTALVQSAKEHGLGASVFLIDVDPISEQTSVVHVKDGMSYYEEIGILTTYVHSAQWNLCED